MDRKFKKLTLNEMNPKPLLLCYSLKEESRELVQFDFAFINIAEGESFKELISKCTVC